MNRSAKKAEIYLEGIYNTVIVKEIEDRQTRSCILPILDYGTTFYRVMIGKVGSTEVDFVAEKQGAYTYFQVTADMTARETFDRELKPLANIRDNYEKIVLTGDRFTVGNYNGIQVKYLPDWVLGKNP